MRRSNWCDARRRTAPVAFQLRIKHSLKISQNLKLWNDIYNHAKHLLLERNQTGEQR